MREGGPADEEHLERLAGLVSASRALFVLTGAGVSTDSGIPAYRDEDGAWTQRAPVQYLDFVRHERTRRRYWARSVVGWPRMAAARPNAAHGAIAQLEAAGRVHLLVTQNVDGLHQAAGSGRVLDLHGRLDGVRCLGCGARTSRAAHQEELLRANPAWVPTAASTLPDGDAAVEGTSADDFVVPPCPACGGIWKPDVVFFGENVPKARVEAAYARLGEADAVLVVGSSLAVFSGYRFVRAAAERGLPIAIVNRGRTRGDAEAAVKVEGPCAGVLEALLGRVAPASAAGRLPGTMPRSPRPAGGTSGSETGVSP